MTTDNINETQLVNNVVPDNRLNLLIFQDHFIIENLAVALEKEGISSFRFDFAGNG